MWFRQDLRLTDNPALHYANETGKPVIAVFVYDTTNEKIRNYGAAQKWWLNHSLTSLKQDLEKIQSTLILRSGPTQTALESIVEETGASAIYWNRRYGELEQNTDAEIKASFTEAGLDAKSFDGLLMHEPTRAKTKAGNPYRVYTPFWKNFVASGPVRAPLPRPDKIKTCSSSPMSDDLESWNLLPTQPDWGRKLSPLWAPGEASARQALNNYVEQNLHSYATSRDFPGPDLTAKISPYLRFGEISPHTCWHACRSPRIKAGEAAREIWAKELVWREFCYHLLHHNPDLATRNFNKKFDSFPWLDDPASNTAQWQWVAGCGADASPYFRIFNPILQSEKFDPDGLYIKQYVPELSALPAKYLHTPWETPTEVLTAANIELGITYPAPIIDHKFARNRALAALATTNR